MSLLSWLGLGHSQSRCGAATVNPRRRSCRLLVEGLEDRCVPASYNAATVPDLIAAIDAANLTAEADTIALAPGARFTLTAQNNTHFGANGLPVIAAGGDVTILGSGNIIERSTATETAKFRLFNVAAGASLRLESVTLQGGWAVGGWDSIWDSGGGILNQGSLTLKNVTVQNNRAGRSGGGIHSTGTLTIESSIIQNNQAIGFDGADALPGRPDPTDGTNGGSASGGGLTVTGGTATLTGVTLSGNLARGGKGGNGMSGPNGAASGSGGHAAGGGLFAAGATVRIANSSITNNSAVGGAAGKGQGGIAGRGIGGGLYIMSDAVVLLDALTLNNVKRNKASTSHPNIYGTYDLIS